MSQTLREKLHTLTFASLHKIVDSAIDMNSLPVVEQHIRDLEQAMYELQKAQAENQSSIAGLQRQISALHTEEAKFNFQADQVLKLSPPRDDLALIVEQRLQDVENKLGPLGAQLEKAQGVSAQYGQAMSAIQAKHTVMLNHLQELQSMDQSATAEDHAAKAIHAVNAAIGSAGSVDSVEARIQQRSDLAHARLNQEVGSIVTQEDPVAAALAGSDMQQRLAARKARLGIGGPAQTQLPPPRNA